jgi:hypothetical protein
MKNTSRYILFVLFFFTAVYQVNAQIAHNEVCGTTSPSSIWENDFQKQIQSYLSQPNAKRANTFTIPVVIHLLYSGSTESTIGTKANLHPDQIKAQMEALNEVFAGNAPGNSTLPSVFANVDANDIGITFCLATKDENGNTMQEPGVERIDWEQKGWTNPGSFNDYAPLVSHFDNTVKPQSIWDPTKYLNVWLGDFTAGTGYATFPPSSTLPGVLKVGTSSTDGVFVSSRIFGCQNKYPNGYYSPNNDYVEGDIAAHEIGHWLGLRHIWGDANCGNDYCNDTPPQQGSNEILCPQHPYKKGYCSGNTTGEMFQNYMGYTQDACMCLFTADQKTRIITAMNNSPYRKLLGSHGLCSIGTAVSHLLDNNSLSFEVVPDNRTGEITTSFHASEKGDYVLEVKNLLGQVLYSEQLKNVMGAYSKQIHLSHLTNGLYLVSLSDTQIQSVKKIVLNK